MAELTVDMTYGQALYDAAKELNKQEVLLEEGNQLQKIFEAEPNFFMLLSDPTIAGEEKKKLLVNVFQDKMQEELLNLLFILIDKRRVRNYQGIMKHFQKLKDEDEGLSAGKVFSAVPLTEENIKRLEGETGKLLRENVKLINEVDPKLIGGIKILIDGKIIDASIKRRIEDLAEEMY